MGVTPAPGGRRSRAARPLAVPAVVAAMIMTGCSGSGVSKAGGQPAAAPPGTITLTFATAEVLPVDTTFATLVNRDSGGHLKLRGVGYDGNSTSVDETIATDLRSGKLDVADVGSRAWESLGVTGFRAYQDPFLISSRELLDAATTGAVATGLLGALRPAGISGLAIVPGSIRYLYSTRPLTAPSQLFGAKVRISASATTSEMVTALDAAPVTSIPNGTAATAALQDGQLAAIEADPLTASEHRYVQAAPYVAVNAPLFAKTTTIAVNSRRMARLPTRDAGWLRQAARQAAAAAATDRADRTYWALACGQGLKPVVLTGRQLAAFQQAEAPVYASLAADQQTSLAEDRIGGLAIGMPRMDTWATCHGAGITSSPTKVLDGSYQTRVTQAEVVADGDCTDCGDAGTFRLAINNGRYALYRPVQINDNPAEPSVAFNLPWRPADPQEVGTVAIAGNRVTFVPEVNQQNGSVPTVYTFELFRGLITWHQLSGSGWDTSHPWRKIS